MGGSGEPPEARRPLLQRRLTISSTDFDLELRKLTADRGYTSIRDVLSMPSFQLPPAAGSDGWAADIPIKNRLVQTAARAYLRPAAVGPDPSLTGRIRRCFDASASRVMRVGSWFGLIGRCFGGGGVDGEGDGTAA